MKIYDEAITYVANQRIEIDLDDGVLAEVPIAKTIFVNCQK